MNLITQNELHKELYGELVWESCKELCREAYWTLWWKGHGEVYWELGAQIRRDFSHSKISRV